ARPTHGLRSVRDGGNPRIHGGAGRLLKDEARGGSGHCEFGLDSENIPPVLRDRLPVDQSCGAAIRVVDRLDTRKRSMEDRGLPRSYPVRITVYPISFPESSKLLR